MVKKILIADDNQDCCDILTLILQGGRYEISVARNGNEAIQKIKDHPPDLILLDVMMPEKTGLEVCEWVKKNPETCHIFIIIVTASSEQSHRKRGFSLGASDYITKPIVAADVLTCMEKLLGPHAA
ncbi:MAG TPA: response regulator [Candidatus Manganitrophaceae bacterium]|nr:response regulator [Candidatus Manganitrophaceae bacterium]